MHQICTRPHPHGCQVSAAIEALDPDHLCEEYWAGKQQRDAVITQGAGAARGPSGAAAAAAGAAKAPAGGAGGGTGGGKRKARRGGGERGRGEDGEEHDPEAAFMGNQ
jgi:hypothetical protein